MSQIGRPPKAKSKALLDEFPGAFKAFLGRKDDPLLEWHESSAEIRKSLQTIGGIASLAKVDRKTVTRRGIAPNSVEALEFVVRERIKKGRPLVSYKERIDHRNATPRFLSVLAAVRQLNNPHAEQMTQSVVDKEAKTSRQKWRQGRNQRHDPNIREIKPQERVLFKSGRVFHYNTAGRVTVTKLCSLLRMSRAGFYKWKAELPHKQRQLLENQMAGKLYSRPTREASRVSWSGDAVTSYQDTYDEILRRIDGA